MEKFKIVYEFASNANQQDKEKKRFFSETVTKQNIQEATEHAESYKNRVQDCSGFTITEKGGN